ncbi:MAG: hypothetical protein JKY67_21310 [Pseudomonadales bacterium]|nr:hypothetical protein [Pseudomonadales bacterium]
MNTNKGEEQARLEKMDETRELVSVTSRKSEKSVPLPRTIKRDQSALSLPLKSISEEIQVLDINDASKISKVWISKVWISEVWITDVEMKPEITLNDRITVKTAIQFDNEKVKGVNKGDKFKLMLPGGSEFVVSVEQSKVYPNGGRSWSGHLEGHQDQYPVVFTFSPSNNGNKTSFATITTPNGSYSMESVNGNGWVYQNPAEQELNESDHQDSLMIPTAGDFNSIQE